MNHAGGETVKPPEIQEKYEAAAVLPLHAWFTGSDNEPAAKWTAQSSQCVNESAGVTAGMAVKGRAG